MRPSATLPGMSTSNPSRPCPLSGASESALSCPPATYKGMSKKGREVAAVAVRYRVSSVGSEAYVV